MTLTCMTVTTTVNENLINGGSHLLQDPSTYSPSMIKKHFANIHVLL